MKKERIFKWFMLVLIIACTMLSFAGCCSDQANATLYCNETGETVTLSTWDTQQLRKLLNPSDWEEFLYAEYFPNYKLTLDRVEYRFETLDYDPVYGECISYCSKDGELSGIIPRDGTEKYQRILKILRRNMPA